MLAEAITIMNELWTGEFVTHRGECFDADHVKVYEHLGRSVDTILAVSGEQSLDLAESSGCVGIMATEPDAAPIDGWGERGGSSESTWAEVPLAWEPTKKQGIETARRFRFGMAGWNMSAELPNPAHFADATQFISDDQADEAIPNGPDPEPYIEAIQCYRDAGFHNLAVVPVGDDIEGTLDFFDSEIRPHFA